MAKNTKQKDAAQNQHYVPKFMLRNFLSNADKEQVTVFDKETSKAFPTNIRGIMAERRFNEFVIDEQWLASFEPAICEIEDMVLPAYKRVVENRRLDKTDEERAQLAYLIAFQFVRTKAQRDRFTQMDQMIRDKWGGIDQIGTELAEMDDPAMLKMRHADFIKESMKEFTGLIAIKDLLLMEAPVHRSFYLGDNPVAMHNNEKAHPFWGNIGLAIQGIEIYLPLTSNLTLCALCPSILEKQRTETAERLFEFRSALLSKLTRGELTPAEMQARNGLINDLAKPITDRISHFDDGMPISLNDSGMDFYNSLQVSHSARHVICPQGDFKLAQRFMTDNPGHKGQQIRTS